MYICTKCDELFETHNEYDTGYGVHLVCPFCGSTETVEAVRHPVSGDYVTPEEAEGEFCKGCGEWVPQAEYDAQGACKDCINKVKGEFAKFFGSLEPWKQNVLELASDGKWLRDINDERIMKNG